MTKLNNPFCGRTDGVTWQGNNYAIKEYAKGEVVQKVNSLSKDDDTIFDVVKEFRITDIVDLQDYVNSFSDEVGLINILKKVAKTGDASLVNQCQPGYVDLTDMPTDFLEAKAMYESAMSAYDKLPDAIKNGMSADDFVKLTASNLDKSLNDYVAGLTQIKEEKVGGNNDE